jgi:broad specificity phosphatase PhoE
VNVYLVRHAQAGDRREWDGPDAGRPLNKKGRQHAEAIAEVLATRPIARVLSSPAVRCVQTVEPLAARLGVDIEVTATFAEGARFAAAREVLDTLAKEPHDTVVCGHGDVIPELLESLEAEGTPLDGAGCAKGSIWRLVADDGRFIRGDYHRHPDPELASG